LAFACLAPVASAYVYWTDNGSSSNGTTIGRANLDGSGANTSLIGSAYGPGGIVSDGSHIYWINDNVGVYSIGRANIDGTGANPTFISGAATSGGGFAITTDGTYLYWTDGSRYVGRAKVDGTGANGHFLDMGSGNAPFGITVYGGMLYIGEASQIMRAPYGGGASPTLFTALTGFGDSSLAAANGYVYWTENFLGTPSPNGVIGREAVNGAGPNESYVSGLVFPTGLATDGNQLYWVDHTAGAIGRATIGSSGATNIQPTFVSDSGGPFGVALDSAIDATRTTVACSPPSLAVGSVSACTATVGDPASTSVPTGTIVFSSAGSTYFSGGNSCTVTPRPGGGASCTVAAAASVPGTQGLAASYSGDPVHSPSSGAGGFCAGTAVQCGGTGPGGPGGKPACTVPKLKGKSLATARRLLAAANCRLGKIVRPRARRGHPLGRLVVGSEQPRAGTALPNGSTIDVRLVPRHAARRHR
jgi:hypothetical protein